MTEHELNTQPIDLKRERWELLEHINRLTDKPMTALAFVWVLLLIIDFTSGLNRLLEAISYLIWGLFIADFLIEFVIAPHKTEYLRRNWITVLSLVLPAFRILRIFRAFRALQLLRTARTVGLLRLITSLNRSIRATAKTMSRRNIGYVVAVTVIVIFAGAAGMAFFESPHALQESANLTSGESGGLQSYSEAVWWTAMLLTTMGSGYWPQTVEGRILCWLLSVYAFAIFGYITATIASYFIGQDKLDTENATIDDSAQTQLRHEIAQLKDQIAALTTAVEHSHKSTQP